jgi:hypothetical protein
MLPYKKKPKFFSETKRGLTEYSAHKNDTTSLLQQELEKQYYDQTSMQSRKTDKEGEEAGTYTLKLPLLGLAQCNQTARLR